MRARFLAVVQPTADAAPLADQILARRDAQPAFTVALHHGRTLVLTAGTFPVTLGERGVILGSLFDRACGQKITQVTRDEQDRILASGGRHLIHAYWGGYVAILRDNRAATVTIVRAPMGDLPCYRIARDGATILASDMDVLIAFGLFSRSIAWPALARFLAAREIRHPETCLAGLVELPGGHACCIRPADDATTALWSPWAYCGREQQIDDREDATRRVRDSVLACVQARASECDGVVLMLSGGLDSSILAACLAPQDRPVAALNLVTADPTGDERGFAQAVADRLNLALHERLREVRDVDTSRSLAAHLPRPTARLFQQASRRAACDMASIPHGSAVFGGGGGDNVFCSVQSVAPVVDRLLTTGLDRNFWKTASDISRLAPASLWSVVTGALKRIVHPHALERRPADLRLLSATAVDHANAAPTHPWLIAPADVLPGKAAHVASIAFAQSFVEGLDPQSDPQFVAPLLAQPIVETCLRIPSWLCFDDGLNRAIARRAFAPDLPAQIVRRRSKGRPDSFSAELFDAYRPEIRDLVLGGALAAQGLLDTGKVTAVIDGTGPIRSDDFHRILDFVDAEAWIGAQG